MSDIDLIIQTRVDGIKDITSLSSSLKFLNTSVKGVFVPMSKLDSHTRALNKALAIGAKGAREHATNLKGLRENQKVLREETRRLTKDIRAMQSLLSRGRNTSIINPDSLAALKQMRTILKSTRLRAFSSDIQSIGLSLKKLGKDAQFVGRSLMINLTAPIALFSRFGLQSLRDYDREAVRLTKVLENVAMTTEQAMLKTGIPDASNAKVIEFTDNFQKLDSAMIDISRKFGIARSLATGLAADFAELGISSIDNITAITRLTAATEKLGGMDITESQELIQAMYFQSVRAFESAGRSFENAAEREKAAISSATANLQMFNAIENVTALTLRDLGAAFPEVAGMATTFGLSMIEAAAMLAPMKAAGLNVGASANAIKVSLQRLVAPTKQNEELMKRLSQTYKNTAQGSQAFENATRSGLTGLLGIVEAFQAVRTESGGLEAPMQLMSKIFGVRQGPRMMLAIQQLADFDEKLRGVGVNAKSAEKALADIATSAAKNSKLSVDNFTKIGVIARVATAQVNQEVEGFGRVSAKDINDARRARKAVGEEILRAQREGRDIMSDISTEAGRAMITQLAGASSASAIANRELDQALGSLDVTINVLKNNFKLFASDIIKNLRPAIELISRKSTELLEKWKSLAPEVRERIGKLILAVAGGLAAIGPLILAMGTLSSVTGIALRGFFKFIPGLKLTERGFLDLTEAGKAVSSVFRKTSEHFDTLYKKLIGRSPAMVSSIQSLGTSAIGTGIPIGAQYPTLTKAPALAPITPAAVLKRQIESIVKITGGSERDALAGLREAQKSSGKFLRKDVMAAKLAAQQASVVSTKDVYRVMQSESRLLHRQNLAQIAKENAAKLATYQQQKLAAAAQQKQLIANATKRKALESAGISSRLSRDASGKAIIQRTFKGRDITDLQAGNIAMGGVRGRLTKIGVAARGMAGDVATAIKPSSIKAASVAPFTKSVQGARAAVASLNAQAALVGASTPGAFSKAAAAMTGFIKATKGAVVMMKILKMVVITSAIGLVITAIAVAVVAVVKNFDRFKEVASDGIQKVKDAFNVLKNAVMEIIRPFVDLFSMFGKGSEGGKGAAEGLAKAFNMVGTAVSYVANLISALVMNVIQPILYYWINLVMAIISAFKGNWGEALGFLQSAFAHAMTALINMVGFAVKIIIKVFFGLASVIPKAIGFGLKFALDLLTGFVRGALKLLSFLPGPFGGISDLAEKGISAIKGVIDAGSDAASGAIASASNAATGFVDTLTGKVKQLLEGMKGKGIKASVGKVFGDAKDQARSSGDELGRDAAEAITNATGEELDDTLAERVGKALKDSLKGLAQKLVDYVMGEMDDALKNFVKRTEDALKKQRDAAIAVYDQQIKTLMKLERAEESLTRTKEYESQRRQMIDERALQYLNYQRNRALAIYEGRIDDARMLDLEDLKNSRDSQKQIADLDSARRKDLAKENLDALRDAINEAKDAADKFFDESIEKFREAATEITKFPPVTIEDYKAQLAQLTALATQTANDTGIQFGKMFDEFVTTVNEKMPNEGIPAFTENLDTLVQVAVQKYGLGTSTGDSKTIIGATIGMLTQMGASFGENKQFVVDSFGTITDGLITDMQDGTKFIVNDVMAEFFAEYKKAVEESDADKVLAKAIADGNRAIIDDFRKTVGGVGSAVDDMVNHLDPLILQWAKLQAQAEAAGQAQKNAAGGGASGGTPSGGPLTVPELRNLRPDLFQSRRPSIMPYTPVMTMRGYGGRIKRMAIGGYLNAAASQSVPALLHGGEYVMSAKAVRNIGLGALERMNNTRFMAPRRTSPSGISNITMSTQNTNIYVENFIGEEEWFKSMMKEYSINTLPKNQKAAGVEPRVVRTYNGINQVM